MPARGAAYDGHDIYEDSGCELAPRCLSCYLPVCKYDMSPQQRNALQGGQTYVDKAVRVEGMLVKEAAETLGCTVRTVWKIREKARNYQELGG